MGMQEAFRRAARNNPRSDLSRDVGATDSQISADRRQEGRNLRLERLKKNFLTMGQQWFNLEIDTSLWAYLQKDKRELMRDFNNALSKLGEGNEEELAVCLIQLAEGMGISEENLHLAYRDSIGSWILNNPIQQIRYELSSTHLSNSARIFVGQFATLAGYSEEELRQLNDYLHREAGLSGKVKLTDTTAAMAHWIISKRQ